MIGSLLLAAALTAGPGFAQDTVGAKKAFRTFFQEVDTVLLGDIHDENGRRKDLRSRVAMLKSLGVTHLAVEVVENWQPLMSGYQRTMDEDYLDRLKKKMYDGMGKPTQSQKAMVQSYIDLWQAAMDGGLYVVCMDLPSGDKRWDDWNSEETFSAREKHWAKKLKEYSGGRRQLVVLAGRYHTQISRLPKILKDKHGISAITIDYQKAGYGKRAGQVRIRKNGSRYHATLYFKGD